MKLEIPRVLVVDDDAGFCEALARWLETLGYRNAAANSVEEAVELVDPGEVDVILLDVRLPGLRGHVLLQQLNRQGIEIPVVMMSGASDIDDVIESMRHNAVDFLRKPFQMDQLETALERALERRRRSESPATGPAEPAAAQAPAVPAAAPAAAPAPAAPASTAAPAPEPKPKPRPTDVRDAVKQLAQKLHAGTVKLPVLDPRVGQLQLLMEQPDAGIEEFVELIAADPALAASVIRVANSAYYRSPEEIRTLKEACTRLGNKGVFSVVYELLVQNAFGVRGEPYRSILTRLWQSTFISARIARRLAERLERPDREELYLATLLHNIGEVLLLQLLSELGQPGALEQIAGECARMHQPFGDALARSWKLPKLFIRLAGYHHGPAATPEPESQRIERHLVLAAWKLALACGFTYFPGQENEDPEPSLAELGLTLAAVEPLMAEARSWT